MTLAATSLGLGSHWASLVASTYPSAMIRDLLGIPDGYCIYDMLGIGHPAMEAEAAPGAGSGRHDPSTSGYDQAKYRTDEQIREWLISLRK